MAILDAKTNFGKTKVLGTYSATDTQITVEDATRFPAVPFNVWWWDDGNYPDPSDDPNREIVRVNGITGNVLTLISSGGNRTAQEGTTSTAKNTANTSYSMSCGWTKRDADAIESAGIDVGDKYVWITEHNAIGDGVIDDKPAFDAAVAAGYTFIVVPSGTWRIGADLTLATTITLQCLPGCLLAPDAGKTLTINGEIIAGNYRIFGGSGTVTVGSRSLLQYDRWRNGTLDRPLIYGFPVIVESGALDISSTGVVTCAIAHGLGSAPSVGKIALSAYRSSGTNEPAMRQLVVTSTDSTNVNVYVYVTVGAASTYVKVVAMIFP